MRRLRLSTLVCSTLWCIATSGLDAQGLFRDTAVLNVTIVTDLRTVIRDRDSTKFVPHGAMLSYADPGGGVRSFPVTVRARGHFRRQSRNCAFPPLKLEFKRDAARGTLFQGNDELKITTNCRPGNAEFEQYILGEYAMYRAYELVSPRHFRTRLARITYRDSTRSQPEVNSWAFFVEEDKEVAKRFRLRLDDSRGALFADLDTAQTAITALFEFMAGNTDWSISALHNVSLMRDSIGGFFPVAYDFDWSGAVNPRYAFPDARLGIRAVTDRLYRGPCLSAEQWQRTIARFVAARPAIEAVYNGLTAMEPQRKRTALEYLAQFYRTIGDQRAVKIALMDTCQPKGN